MSGWNQAAFTGKVSEARLVAVGQAVRAAGDEKEGWVSWMHGSLEDVLVRLGAGSSSHSIPAYGLPKAKRHS